MYARLPYYAEGAGHFWMLDREKTTSDHPQIMSAGGLAGSSYNRDFRISEDDVHTVLWHAGVSHCRRTTQSTPIYLDSSKSSPPHNVSFFLTKLQGAKTVVLEHELATAEDLAANKAASGRRGHHPVVKVALDDVDAAPRGWLRCLPPLPD